MRTLDCRVMNENSAFNYFALNYFANNSLSFTQLKGLFGAVMDRLVDGCLPPINAIFLFFNAIS